MKKISLFLSLLLLLLTFSGCSSQTSEASASDIYQAIQSAFQDKYGSEAILNAPTEIDDTTLSERFHLTSEEVDDYKGVTAGMMTNCDELLVVKARPGKIEAVKNALHQALEEQKEQFGWYAVMDNVERLEAARVVSKGNYAALLIVGISPEDPDISVDFTDDVSMAEKAFLTTIG